MIVRLNGGRHVKVHSYWNGKATMFQAAWCDNQGRVPDGRKFTSSFRSFDLAVNYLMGGGKDDKDMVGIEYGDVLPIEVIEYEEDPELELEKASHTVGKS